MTNMVSMNYKPYLLGVVFCCIVAMLPELAPMLATRDGFIWSPVHSTNYHPGDLYYYAAYVAEIIQNGLPLYSPSAAELSGRAVIETWRFVPILLGTLPSVVTGDIRFVLLIDYALSAFLFFSLPYWTARKFIDSRWAAACVGLATYFLADPLWVNLPIHPSEIQDGVGWLGLLFASAARNLARLATIGEYDFYGSTFRFVNLSLSGPILLTYFFVALNLHLSEGRQRSRAAWLGVLVLLSPVMAFSYPSHALISYGLLGAFAIVNFLQGNRSKSLAFSSLGLCILLFLFSIDYFSILSNTLNNSELWKNIFAGERFVLRDHTLSFLAGVAFNKYLLSFTVMLLLARKQEKLLHVIYAVGIVGLPLSMVTLLDTPQLWSRFLGRGVDHIWFMFIAICVASAFQWVRSDAEESRGVWRGRIMAVGLWALVSIMVALPTYTFGRLALLNIKGDSRYLPTGRLLGYQWINKHIPRNATVVSLNWDDISLLPIYTSATLVVGHSVLDGRSPMDELSRFVESWKFLGRSKDELIAMMAIAPGAIRDQHRSAYRGAKVPFLWSKEFDAAQFMEGVVYWPYVKKVGDVPIVGEYSNTRGVSVEYQQLVLRLFDTADPETYVSRYSVQAVIIDARDLAAQSHMDSHAELFRNSELVIYSGIKEREK